MKKYLFIILLVGVCFGQTKEENAGKIIESAGNDIVEYVNTIEDLINKIQQFDRIKINLNDNENYQKSKKIFLEKNLGNDFFNNKNIFKKEFTDIYQN